LKPFDAPAGTVWEYKDYIVDLYVVLDRYSDNVPDEHPGKEFRMCLDLLKGEIVWMARLSHYNNDSTRIA
jgi:hypothetical protein